MWATTRISDSAVITVGHNEMSDPVVWASPQSDQMRSNVRLHSMYPHYVLLDDKRYLRTHFWPFLKIGFMPKT
jgi:hypothetical protein